jgi:UPF0176 protein
MSSQETVASFYKFIAINDAQELKSSLKSLCAQLKLQGTIILAPEGINGMVAGSPAAIASLQEFFKEDARFADLRFKLSYYQGPSFRRMLVKIKKQALTLRKPADPVAHTGKRLSPAEFKEWLASGKEMILLDTRNDYEVAIGTFRNAIDPKLRCFDEFTQWIDTNLQDAKDQPIVTFCTGGIRCEKATAYMLDKGFRDVYQLDGGIVTYLEHTMDTPDNGWDGECVVFDKRIAIDKQLRPSQHPHCFVCLTRLGEENTAKEHYPAGTACTRCAEHMHQHQQERLVKGMDLHHKNLQQRKEYIAEQKRKFGV